MNKKLNLVQKLLLCGFFLFVSTDVKAQITPDSTLRGESSKITPNLIINGANGDLINGGALRGDNLFHSFTEFNIKDGQSVYFANPSGVVNILTRVTGSNASNILGTLGVDGAANLFLINPNGILFGRNASLDLRGSFVGTTANGVQFGNQGNFSATNPEAPGLLTINPSALFFNQINPNAAIVNNSVAPVNFNPAGFIVFGLQVPDGESLLLVGGNVSMDGGELNALGGRVELGGLAEPGTVALDINNDNFRLVFPENVTRASVSLTNQAQIHVESAGGGDITINAQNIEILGGSGLLSGIGLGLEAPTNVAGNITLNATGEIKIAGTRSGIRNVVQSGAKGNGGNIVIDTGSFNVSDGGIIVASTFGQGNAGNITVNATGAVSLKDAAMFSSIEAGAVGKGGTISINAASLSLANVAQLLTATRAASRNQPAGKGSAGDVDVKVTGVVDIAGKKNEIRSGIFSNIEAGAEGQGGNITIDTNSFKLRDGAQLLASTFGIGNGGNVKVTASNSVSLMDNAAIGSTVEASGVGKAGNITIDAATLSLQNGAQISTSTGGASNTQGADRTSAGNVNVKVTGVVDIAGKKDTLPSAIFSSVDTGAEGQGGNITIDAGSFKLLDSAQLATSTLGIGNAGNVKVTASDVVFLENSNIFSTVEAGAVGKGGNIDINAAKLTLLSGAQLLTSTREASNTQPPGRGDVGNVNIKVTDSVHIAGKKDELKSGIRSLLEIGTVGNGGNITIDTGSFKLLDGAQLVTSTFGQGNAGNVAVNASNSVSLINDAIIASTVGAGGVGKGGNIDINAATLTLLNVAQLQTATRGAKDTQPPGKGDAGNVNINVTGAVEIAGKKDRFYSAIFSNVEAGTVGNAGNIIINAGSFKLIDDTRLESSTSGLGNAGNIFVTAKDSIYLADEAFIFGTVETGGIGTGGNININAATLTLADSAQVATAIRGASATQSAGKGSAGNITIDTATLSLQNGAAILSSTFGQGNAGNITLLAKDALQLVGNGSYILSTVEAGGVGKGGNIDINTAKLSILEGAQLLTSTREASNTQPPAKGDAGNVNVLVIGTIDIAGREGTFLSGIFSSVGTGTEGRGGNITIEADSLNLRDGAEFQTSTKGQGNAGNVTLNLKDTVSLTSAGIFSSIEAGGIGKGGDIDINAATLSLTDGAQIVTGTGGASATQTAGRGDAGNVNVKVSGEVNITGVKNGFSSGIFSSVQTDTVGNGGNITISADSFKLSSGAILNARTENSNRGGNINVNTNKFEALDGGQLVSTTSNNGSAGKITVNATDKVTINGIDPNYSNRLTIFPNISNIGANAGFFVNSTGQGTTGDIEINSPNITLDNQGKLQANSASGNGGNINLNSDLLLLRRGAQISTNAGTEQKGGDGGNIDIDSRFIVAVLKENSDITANAFTGRGGNVNIRAQGIFGIEPRVLESLLTSDITASSQSGVQGQISITEPDVQPAQGLVELPEEVVDATRRVAQICPREPGAKPLGEFTITGRGSLPPSPLEPLPGDTNTTKLATLDNNTNVLNIAPNQMQNAITEAQGWVKNNDGSLELVATAPVTTPEARTSVAVCPS
ncbi:filamentous haemagglutinin outer membrane protein [Calothrix sp. PCC 7716]|nr:filamentous haemagglutinin outer membrane protein [Calothrix sp. PCC 7716]